MAAIINAQTAVNEPAPRPMLPGIEPMWRATNATPTHAPAAATSKSDAGGVGCRSLGTAWLPRLMPVVPSPRPCRQWTRRGQVTAG
jgi:hypothetical protein